MATKYMNKGIDMGTYTGIDTLPPQKKQSRVSSLAHNTNSHGAIFSDTLWHTSFTMYTGL